LRYLILLSTCAIAQSQPSSGPLLVPFDLQYVNTTITCVPDASNPQQFYYFPVAPRLATQTINGKTVPTFQLLNYNFSSLKGGLLTFALTLALPDDALNFTRNAIAKKISAPPESIDLGMLPLLKSTVTLLVTTNSGLATTVLGTGEGPRHPGASIPFSIQLTPEGSSVFEALAKGAAGIGVNMQFDYEGLTPEIDCRVTGNWDQVYTYYGSVSDLKAEVGGWFFGGSVNRHSEELRDNLDQKAGVHVRWNRYPPNPESESAKRVVKLVEESVLTRIMDAVFTNKPPTPDETLPPNTVGDTSGWYGGVNYGVSIREKNQQRHGNLEFTYVGRAALRVAADPIGNAINVGGYPDDIKKSMFVNVDENKFFQTLFVTCDASVDPSQMRLISLVYSLARDDGKVWERGYRATGQQMLPIGANDVIDIPIQNPPKRVTLKTKVTVQSSSLPKTAVSDPVGMSRNGYQFIQFEPDVLGLDYIEIDFSNILLTHQALALLGGAPQLYFVPREAALLMRLLGDTANNVGTLSVDDTPSSLSVVLTHGTERYDRLVTPANKNQKLTWFIKKDNIPLTCRIIGRNYSFNNKDRECKLNAQQDLKTSSLILQLDNSDFPPP
jgi:hypothetical protein